MKRDPPPLQSVKELFLEALKASNSREIVRILDAADCDASVRAEVEKLLAAHASDSANVLDRALDRFGPTENATIVENSPDLQTGTIVGSFIIREAIGEGGMGTVYAAEQTEPVRRKVALKIIRAAIATNDVIARFEAECQAIALMDHPNIAKVLEVGTTSAGQPYLAMELVQGLSITKYADAHRLTTDQRLRLFEKVCLAVRHAHHKGVIHRDLKPSNILVAHVDDTAVPKIIDFGLAKAIDQPLTDATVYTGFSRMIGTPMYMSPEQAELGVIDVDTRSDVYSLGVILYELLTGVPPFERERFRSVGFDEIRRVVREVEPRRPSHAISTQTASISSTIAQHRGIEASRLRAKLRGELDWIVLKALEKNRERRYDSAADLARDIRRYLCNETVEACPPSKAYRLKKYVWRHRWTALVASTVFAALVVICSVSLWQVWQVRRANLAIAAREKRSNDLLEAMRFREAIEQYRLGNLAALSNRLQAWSEVDSDPLAEAEGIEPPGLMSLLKSAATVPPLTMRSNEAPIHDLATTGNGKFGVSVDERGDVLFWDMSDPESIALKLGSHGKPAHAVAISPDGRRAVTGGKAGTLIFWDLEAKAVLHKVAALKTGVETIRYSPDGKFVAAGGRYSGVWVGDDNGEVHFAIENDQRHEALLFTPDGSQLLVPTRGSHINVWNVAAGRREGFFDTGLQTNVRAMCFAGKDSRWLVVGDRFSESLTFIDRQSGEQAGQVIAAAYPRALTASPDGLWVAASYADGRVRLIQLSDRRDDRVTGEVRFQFQAHRPAESARVPLQWLDSRYAFVSAGFDGKIAQWSRSHIPCVSQISPPDPLYGALLKPGRPKPYFFYFDHLRAELPQLDDYANPLYFPQGIVTETSCNGQLAFAQHDQITIVKLATGEVVSEVPSPLDSLWWIHWSPDGKAMIGGNKQRIAIWESDDAWRTHKLVRTVDFPSKFRPTLADGHRIAILHDDVEENLVEFVVKSGESRTLYTGDVICVCLSHHKQWLAVADQQSIRVIDRRTGQIKAAFHSNSAPKQLCFFPDDKVLLSHNSDGSIRAWHIATGETLGALYAPQSRIGDPVFLQITDDGKRILACYESINTRIPIILGRP